MALLDGLGAGFAFTLKDTALNMPRAPRIACLACPACLPSHILRHARPTLTSRDVMHLTCLKRVFELTALERRAYKSPMA